jgi:glutathione S-transferase
MSLIFYGSPMSTATITELVLAELGVAFEHVRVDIRAGGSKKPEFLKINPNGKVPVVVHDGVAIFESSAITMYLGETFGVEKKLYPAPGTKRGEAMKWIAWTSVSLGEAVSRWTRNTMDWSPADQRNAKAGETAKNDMTTHLGILDTALEGRAFLGGADYTLADTHVNSFVDWLRFMKVDLSAFANIEAWGKRCSARPAYAKVMSSATASGAK